MSRPPNRLCTMSATSSGDSGAKRHQRRRRSAIHGASNPSRAVSRIIAGRPATALRHPLQQFARGGIEPVQILDHQAERPVARQQQELLDQHRQHPFAQQLRRQRPHRRVVGRHARPVPPAPAAQPASAASSPASNERSLASCTSGGSSGSSCAVMRRKAISGHSGLSSSNATAREVHDSGRRRRYGGEEMLHQARLADAGLADHQHGAVLPGARAFHRSARIASSAFAI